MAALPAWLEPPTPGTQTPPTTHWSAQEQTSMSPMRPRRVEMGMKRGWDAWTRVVSTQHTLNHVGGGGETQNGAQRQKPDPPTHDWIVNMTTLNPPTLCFMTTANSPDAMPTSTAQKSRPLSDRIHVQAACAASLLMVPALMAPSCSTSTSSTCSSSPRQSSNLALKCTSCSATGKDIVSTSNSWNLRRMNFFPWALRIDPRTHPWPKTGCLPTEPPASEPRNSWPQARRNKWRICQA